MFLKSFGLVFLAISVCVQANPAPNPCDEVTTSSSTTTSPPGNGNNGRSSTATSATTATRTSTSPAASASASGVQASLTLDSKVISPAFAQNGQTTPPTPGQVASLTSKNNFINFCANFPNVNLTNGKQLSNGSCNPAPMGLIPSSDKMPSCKFIFPTNFDVVKANQNFTIQMAIINMEVGIFTNPNLSYFAAPQQLNSNGQIAGHSHFSIQAIKSFNQTTPINPKEFAFFTAVNSASVNGVLSEVVVGGLPVGFYKLSSINTAANNQPVLVPIVQRGALDDAVYFSVTTDGPASSNAKVDNSQNSKPPISRTAQSTPPTSKPASTSSTWPGSTTWAT